MMNIFYIDADAQAAAVAHCDQHVGKMLTETGQMLSTAHRQHPSLPIPNLYRATHVNHPSNVWVRSSIAAYSWTYQLLLHLAAEFQYRFGHRHLTDLKLGLALCIPPNIPSGEFTPPPQCMPDEFKGDDTVAAYRAFYIGEKSSFARWSNGRPMPTWYADGVATVD